MADASAYPKVARDPDGEQSIVLVGDARFGDGTFRCIAGAPVWLEPVETVALCRELADAGADLLHDGTSSQAKAMLRPLRARLELATRIRGETGLPVAVGLTSEADLERVAEIADLVQVAAWHMQDYALLEALGKIDKPVLLRRGATALLDELLHAAEYILMGGNNRVLLCERGIRIFERAYDVTVDFAAVPILRQRTHLPILIDPSEASHPTVVTSMALAAAACGADGVVLELSACDDDLIAHLAASARITRAG
jgi:3-deoxy-7-phosphoheptulonate synthase